MLLGGPKIRWIANLAATLLLLTASGCGDDGEGGDAPLTTTARIVEETIVDARTRDLLLESPAVGATIGVRLLLPPNFASQPQRRWPVLYLLHGAQATPSNGPPNYQIWMALTDVEELSANTDGLEAAALQSGELFADHLRDLGGHVTTDFYGPGTHTWRYFQQELHRAFPILIAAVGAS